MSVKRYKTESQINAEIDRLIKKKEALAEEKLKLFSKIFFTKAVKKRLSDMEDARVREAAQGLSKMFLDSDFDAKKRGVTEEYGEQKV